MRPTLRVLSDELIDQILDEAKRVLAETGMEVRGPEMRRRLIAAGLPTNESGERGRSTCPIPRVPALRVAGPRSALPLSVAAAAAP